VVSIGIWAPISSPNEGNCSRTRIRIPLQM
jgi:hypothetical protein